MDQMAQAPKPASTSQGYGKKIFTPKNIIVYLVIAALAYGAIYYFFFAKKDGGYGKSKDESGYQTNGEGSGADSGNQPIVVTLSSQNNSGQDAVALLVEENGKVKVALSVGNPSVGVSQPIHIHKGKCPDVGDVTFPLANVVDGQSETTIETTLSKLTENPMAINVHKSTDEVKTYVSCGDIQ